MTAIKLFPAIEDVFADNYDQNALHFMPLATIDLASIDNALTGQVHLVYHNNDPYSDEAAEFYNDFCDEYTTSFDIAGNKFTFKADYGFFKTSDDWDEWVEKSKVSYEVNKKAYEQEANLDIAEVVKNIGGQPDWTQDDQWPVNQQGEKLLFICQAWSGDFVEDYCEEEIFLFYDKTNKMAIQVHQVD